MSEELRAAYVRSRRGRALQGLAPPFCMLRRIPGEEFRCDDQCDGQQHAKRDIRPKR